MYKENYEILFYFYAIISFVIDEKHISTVANLIKDLLIQIKQNVLDFNEDNTEDKKFKEQIKINIQNIVTFISNKKAFYSFIVSEILIPFIAELDELNINEEIKLPFILDIIDTFFFQNGDKIYIETFINENGIDKICSLLKAENLILKNVKIIITIFNIMKNILNADDAYKIKMQNLNVPELVTDIIKLNLDKKIELGGRNILFLIKKGNVQLENIEEVPYAKIELNEPISSSVKNFLTSGKIIKIVNDNGDIKEMQLYFNQDLTKVLAKSLKSNLPPKKKYTIEINNIKSIIKGHGTKNFKKCGGFFKSIPKAENCFSIIGPIFENGKPKSINVICNSEKDVDKWIEYMEIVVNYFKKKKLVGFVNIVKETKSLK